MDSLTKMYHSLDFEYFFRNWKFKVVFQKDSNIFKYLTRENKVMEYEEIIWIFDLNRAEKQIVETLQEDWFYLVWEYDFSDSIWLHILKFLIEHWLNPDKDLIQIERKQKLVTEWKNTTLVFIKAWGESKTSLIKKSFSDYIKNNILKK